MQEFEQRQLGSGGGDGGGGGGGGVGGGGLGGGGLGGGAVGEGGGRSQRAEQSRQSVPSSQEL